MILYLSRTERQARHDRQQEYVPEQYVPDVQFDCRGGPVSRTQSPIPNVPRNQAVFFFSFLPIIFITSFCAAGNAADVQPGCRGGSLVSCPQRQPGQAGAAARGADEARQFSKVRAAGG